MDPVSGFGTAYARCRWRIRRRPALRSSQSLPAGQYAKGQCWSGSDLPLAFDSENRWAGRTSPRGQETPQLTPVSRAGGAPEIQFNSTGTPLRVVWAVATCAAIPAALPSSSRRFNFMLGCPRGLSYKTWRGPTMLRRAPPGRGMGLSGLFGKNGFLASTLGGMAGSGLFGKNGFLQPKDNVRGDGVLTAGFGLAVCRTCAGWVWSCIRRYCTPGKQRNCGREGAR